MKLSDLLDNNTRSKLKNLGSKQKKKPEILTDKDLADLMGVRRDTYERRGGSVRRKQRYD